MWQCPARVRSCWKRIFSGCCLRVMWHVCILKAAGQDAWPASCALAVISSTSVRGGAGPQPRRLRSTPHRARRASGSAAGALDWCGSQDDLFEPLAGSGLTPMPPPSAAAAAAAASRPPCQRLRACIFSAWCLVLRPALLAGRQRTTKPCRLSSLLPRQQQLQARMRQQAASWTSQTHTCPLWPRCQA